MVALLLFTIPSAEVIPQVEGRLTRRVGWVR